MRLYYGEVQKYSAPEKREKEAKTMNYLVTGGCGFIGSHVLRQLKWQGHNPICYDLHTHKTSIEQVFTLEELHELTVIEGGLDDQEALVQVMKEHKIDAVIHLAGILGDLAEQEPEQAVKTNILGTIHIFEAALAAGINRVVWASSQSVFGTEEFYRDLYHADLVPNDVVLKPAAGEKGVVEYGDTAPNWIYVEDAARATILAAQCPNPKTRNFTIGGEIKPIPELRDYILRLLPDAQIELLPGVFPSCFNLDSSAAEKELGYKYEYSAEEGARATINLIRAQRGLPLV